MREKRACGLFRGAGRQGQRVQGCRRAIQDFAERGIHHALLLHPVLATKAFVDHGRGIVVVVTRQVTDLDLGVWKAGFNQPLDFTGGDGHIMRSGANSVVQDVEATGRCGKASGH